MRRVAILIAGLAVVVSGCATAKSRPPRAAAPAEVDVTGRWIGTWYGHGIVGIPREQDAFADFVQRGSGGRGVLTLDGAPAAEGVPAASRMAGLSGSRVLLEVDGSDLVLVHELGPRHLKARFRVDGDRMVGHISDAQPPVRIVLERQKPEPPKPAAAPPRPEPQVAAPPPPPPSAVEPAPTPPPPPVAMTPAPGSEAAPSSEAKPEGAPRPAPDEFAEAPQLKAVHFDFDKSAIRPEDVAVLDESAEWLKGNEVLVLIEGHADERGTNEYNLALGERRAKAVREHLVNKGVAAERINTVSYGEERPACTDKNETCWKQNRRAKTLIKPK
jgi:peptidoglycan-associated lipoprotein